MFCNVLLFWFGGRLFIIRVRTKANASLPRLHHNYCFASRHLYDIRKQRGEKILLIGWWETPEVSKHKMCRDRVLLVFSHWVFTRINLSTAAPAASHSCDKVSPGPRIQMLNVSHRIKGVARRFLIKYWIIPPALIWFQWRSIKIWHWCWERRPGHRKLKLDSIINLDQSKGMSSMSKVHYINDKIRKIQVLPRLQLGLGSDKVHINL